MFKVRKSAFALALFYFVNFEKVFDGWVINNRPENSLNVERLLNNLLGRKNDHKTNNCYFSDFQQVFDGRDGYYPSRQKPVQSLKNNARVKAIWEGFCRLGFMRTKTHHGRRKTTIDSMSQIETKHHMATFPCKQWLNNFWRRFLIKSQTILEVIFNKKPNNFWRQFLIKSQTIFGGDF